MKHFAVAAAAIAAVVGTPVSAKAVLDLRAAEGQQSRMENGVEAINSDMPHSSVRIFEVEEKVGKRGTIQIVVLNASDQPTNLGSENVDMRSDSGTAIETISYERLVKEEKHRQMWAAIGAAMGAAANNINAANAGNTYGTVNTYGSGYSSQSTFTAYNPGQTYAAQSLANAQNQQTFDRLGATSAAAMEALKANLRTTTIDPGRSFGGQVMYELPKDLRSAKGDVPLLIRVKVAGDEHVFHGVLVNSKKKK